MNTNVRLPRGHSPLRTHMSGRDWYNVMDWRESQKVLLPHPSSVGSFRRVTAMPVPNFSRVMAKPETMPGGDQALVHPALRRPARSQGIKRFNGETRTYSEWDGLRRDADLYYSHGDCLVHLYGKGNSQRGPSFKIPFDEIRSADCGPLFSICFSDMSSDNVCEASSSTSDSGYSSTSSVDSRCVYIPAPERNSRDDAFTYHLTTRNLFAWIMDKPLVGATLGRALIDLLDRMALVRSDNTDSVMDILAYADRMGYMDFAHSPDYALAFLCFAEHFKIRDLWIDAFVHCVGMNETLCISHEFESVSRVTKALITRSSLEMDLHLGRVTRALSNFLEDELSVANLGLSPPARAHLDRFRSFIHSFYVEKFGYWPPPQGLTFGKELLHSIYSEFNNLYNHLVDATSSESMQVTSGTGGICVHQTVNAFNNRHRYRPLPHSLPLLPEAGESKHKVQSQRALRALNLGNKAIKDVKLLGSRAALMAATNAPPPETARCPLVKAYNTFEQEWIAKPQEKINSADARKVRWIAIYCTLQMLVSATMAPKEVRDSWSPSYEMCCLVTETPWEANGASPPSPAISGSSHFNSEANIVGSPVELERPSSCVSIHPDCEADDYFSHKTFHSRTGSGSSLAPAPLRFSLPAISRTASLRSLQKGVMSTFARRASTHKSSMSLPTSSFSRPTYGDYSHSLTQLSTNISEEENAHYEEIGALSPPAYSEYDASASLSASSASLASACGPRTPTLDTANLIQQEPIELDAGDIPASYLRRRASDSSIQISPVSPYVPANVWDIGCASSSSSPRHSHSSSSASSSSVASSCGAASDTSSVPTAAAGSTHHRTASVYTACTSPMSASFAAGCMDMDGFVVSPLATPSAAFKGEWFSDIVVVDDGVEVPSGAVVAGSTV